MHVQNLENARHSSQSHGRVSTVSVPAHGQERSHRRAHVAESESQRRGIALPDRRHTGDVESALGNDEFERRARSIVRGE